MLIWILIAVSAASLVVPRLPGMWRGLSSLLSGAPILRPVVPALERSREGSAP